MPWRSICACTENSPRRSLDTRRGSRPTRAPSTYSSVSVNSNVPCPEMRSDNSANTSASSLTIFWLTGGSTASRSAREPPSGRTPSNACRSSSASSLGGSSRLGLAFEFGLTAFFLAGDGAGFTGGRSASIFLRSLNGETNIGLSSCGFGLALRGVDFRFLAIRRTQVYARQFYSLRRTRLSFDAWLERELSAHCPRLG